MNTREFFEVAADLMAFAPGHAKGARETLRAVEAQIGALQERDANISLQVALTVQGAAMRELAGVLVGGLATADKDAICSRIVGAAAEWRAQRAAAAAEENRRAALDREVALRAAAKEMSAGDVIREIEARGAELRLDRDQIIAVPAHRLGERGRLMIEEHRPGIIRLLRERQIEARV